MGFATQTKRIGFRAGALAIFAMCFASALSALAGCGAAGPGGDFAYVPTDEDAGAPLPTNEAADDDDQLLRDIEEADIIKIVDSTLYALNQYKGLIIADLSDPDNPALLGNLDLRGRGVEMYVVGNKAYVVLSADYYYYALEGGMDVPVSSGDSAILPPAPEFDGSQLAVIDVSDPTTPTSEGKINLVGFATQSRRVGNIIYVVGTNYIPYSPYAAPAEGNQGFVASVNVADPDDVVAVERETFSGDAQNIHVSLTTIFASGHEYDYDTGETSTNIQVIDISDAAGAIALRDSFIVPGSIQNRFYMDEFENVFRIATESGGFGFPQVRLFTYDAADLDDIQPLGETKIIENESLRAVRFDGPRGFVVTFLQVDPLFVLDLGDPTNPTVQGHLEVPGFSTHLEPRGNRLLAIGIDDTNGNRPAVSYYDVEDPAAPTQLGRVILGPPGSFTDSQAVYDEKAFKIVDALGLIAVPFNYSVYNDPRPLPGAEDDASDDIAPDDAPEYECQNGVQLVDFSDSALTQRGWFSQKGRVSRVGVVGDRLFALSDLSIQTIDITDRDDPKKAGEAKFFDDSEMSIYDNCGYYFPMPLGWPATDQGFFGWEALSAIADLCGLMTGTTALALCLGLSFMKYRIRRQVRAGRR